jgi:uncharacterized membrane-anchored protein YhcB (DUF1043 family)
MTELPAASIIAWGAAGAAFVAAIAAGIVSIITAFKVGKIEAHVNSEKTAMEGTNNMLRRENEMLREMMADSKQRTALLAQAASHLVPLPVPVTERVLDKIETNTAATAEGVQSLKVIP